MTNEEKTEAMETVEVPEEETSEKSLFLGGRTNVRNMAWWLVRVRW